MIYAALSNDGLVKIGRSFNPQNRVKTLAWETGRKVRLACVIDEDNYLETLLLGELADYNVEGEWFRKCPQVFEIIRLAKAKKLRGFLSRADCRSLKKRRSLFKSYEDRAFALRITIKELCESAGITQPGYSMAKSGATKKPVKVLRAIEGALDEMEAEKAAA